jgi:hypothetical protein
MDDESLLCKCGKEVVDCTYYLCCPYRVNDDVKLFFTTAERQRRKRLKTEKTDGYK